MTRAEAYAEGFHEGRRWAEREVRNHSREGDPRPTDSHSEQTRTYALGFARGYRDTWARWDAGTLTWEMLEHAPVGR